MFIECKKENTTTTNKKKRKNKRLTEKDQARKIIHISYICG
jgi:hypothetical protein